jgi:hypothetical protein
VTLSEYLDTRLTPRLQFLADAADLDGLRERLANGDTPTEEQWARLVELELKARARPTLLDQFDDPVSGP